MHDRALGRLLTSPKNGALWHNVLTTYSDRGMMEDEQILRRFEDCLLGHINKPKSTVEEMLQWLPVVLEEFPRIWTVASRAAYVVCLYTYGVLVYIIRELSGLIDTCSTVVIVRTVGYDPYYQAKVDR